MGGCWAICTWTMWRRRPTVAFPKDKTTTAEIDGEDGFQVAAGHGSRTKTKAVDEGQRYAARFGRDSCFKADAADKTDWTKAMADLNARTQGWAFEVPNYADGRILTRKTMADLAKKPDAKATPTPAPFDAARPGICSPAISQ